MKPFAYTIFATDGTFKNAEISWPDEPGYKAIAALIDPIVGGHLEHVTVLHKGKRADMFVNDMGAINRLPANEAATKIYHAASVARGDDVSDAPKIHGPAVLFDDIVWN